MIAATIEQMIAHLKNGNFAEAASLFIKGQNEGLFPGDYTLIETLVKTIGEDTTRKLVIAFAHYPCQFCRKGRTKCRNCSGHGYHIEINAICEQCLGLGAVRCDFCNGSGWMAIEDIPQGLRTTVLLARTQTSQTQVKAILAKPPAQLSENNPSATLRECAQAFIDLDGYMGVFENVIEALEKLEISESSFKNKVDKILRNCAEAALKGKERMHQIIGIMADSAQLEFEIAEEGSFSRKLAERRTEFYNRLADSSDTDTSLSKEHPFLEEAIKKYITEKH